MPPKMSHATGLALVVVADLLWSTVFVVSQIGLEYTDPYTLVFMRFLISSLAILAVAVPYRSRLGLKKELLNHWTWILGFVYAMGFLFQYLGQDMTSASAATLLSNLAPILIPFLAVFLLRERLTALHVVAMAVSFAGLYLVAGFNPSGSLLSLLGYVLLLLTSLSYALFTVMSKRHKTETLGSALSIILVITAILVPFAVVLGGFGFVPLVLPLDGWLAVLYLAIPCTLVAIVIYLKGLAWIGASEAGFLFLLQILVGLGLSLTLLGERFGPLQMLGAALIIIGLLIGMVAQRRKNWRAISQQQ